MSEVMNTARVAAWRTKGMKVDAVGVLEVAEGRVRFQTLHGIVEFDESVADVTFTYPWYQLGAGARINVNGTSRHYLFSPPRRYHGTMQALEEFFLGPAAGVTSGIGRKIAVGRAARMALGSALNPSTVPT